MGYLSNKLDEVICRTEINIQRPEESKKKVKIEKLLNQKVLQQVENKVQEFIKTCSSEYNLESNLLDKFCEFSYLYMNQCVVEFYLDWLVELYITGNNSIEKAFDIFMANSYFVDLPGIFIVSNKPDYQKVLNEVPRAYILELLRFMFIYDKPENLKFLAGLPISQYREIKSDISVLGYELFLAVHDEKRRESLGVWQTPQPVVDFIVRAVNDTLKTQGLSLGSEEVFVYDFCNGTGGFIQQAVDFMMDEYENDGNSPAEIISKTFSKVGGNELSEFPYMFNILRSVYKIRKLAGVLTQRDLEYLRDHLKFTNLDTLTQVHSIDGFKFEHHSLFEIYKVGTPKEQHEIKQTIMKKKKIKKQSANLFS